MSLLQQKYRNPEPESQLEEPWLRDYKDGRFFLMDGLLYHKEKHTSDLTVICRDHVSLILQEYHEFPSMGNMSEDKTKKRVASTDGKQETWDEVWPDSTYRRAQTPMGNH
ncbi:hypothetical protein O181_001586 [Austropuccinia psidii MF-1]|uniref:Uncharacterized protein n=1 Tax=Austropuccinia psidii MF-1 TaxID=1389203 RepID=A0A9Q3BB96_9BASI|nr:hypothetical protein [Austropuccinia psidii MF-1]